MSDITIRLASAEDAPRLTTLCEQLGYPSSEADVQRRLAEEILPDSDHAIYVAESSGLVVGWIHIYLRRLLVSDQHAEVGGLVVDEAYRSQQIGQMLIESAECWACERDCRDVRVRSNVIRERAHRFYERIGYGNVKTQYTFYKDLSG